VRGDCCQHRYISHALTNTLQPLSSRYLLLDIMNNNSSKRVFSLCDSTLLQGKGAVTVSEHTLDTVAQYGLAPDRAYFLATASTVTTYYGADCSGSLRELSNSIAGAANGRLLPAIAAQSGATATSAATASTAADAAVFLKAVGQGSTVVPTAVQPSPLQRAAHRPVRLFLISHTTRKTGAMYVREMGSGGVHTQSCLAPHESFLLDTGAAVLYVWHGADASKSTRELGLSVAIRYAQDMPSAAFFAGVAPVPLVPQPLGQRAAAAKAAVAAGTVPSFGELSVVEVFSGEEPAQFVWCFKDWDATLQKPFDHAAVRARDEVPSPAARYVCCAQNTSTVHTVAMLYAEYVHLQCASACLLQSH
jgi:hypothetical protein